MQGVTRESDLLGAFEEAEIALERALQDHQRASAELREAPLATRAAALRLFHMTAATVSRLHYRCARLRVEIAVH